MGSMTGEGIKNTVAELETKSKEDLISIILAVSNENQELIYMIRKIFEETGATPNLSNQVILYLSEDMKKQFREVLMEIARKRCKDLLKDIKSREEERI